MLSSVAPRGAEDGAQRKDQQTPGREDHDLAWGFDELVKIYPLVN